MKQGSNPLGWNPPKAGRHPEQKHRTTKAKHNNNQDHMRTPCCEGTPPQKKTTTTKTAMGFSIETTEPRVPTPISDQRKRGRLGEFLVQGHLGHRRLDPAIRGRRHLARQEVHAGLEEDVTADLLSNRIGLGSEWLAAWIGLPGLVCWGSDWLVSGLDPVQTNWGTVYLQNRSKTKDTLNKDLGCAEILGGWAC